jgi:hypothetical protein
VYTEPPVFRPGPVVIRLLLPRLYEHYT